MRESDVIDTIVVIIQYSCQTVTRKLGFLSQGKHAHAARNALGGLALSLICVLVWIFRCCCF